MTAGPRVLVAMSGGVDSSVAAALLQKQGYQCIGVFMCLGRDRTGAESSSPRIPDSSADPRCCSPQDASDARAVANQLGIEFEVVDFRQDMDSIIRYFVEEYRQARTPNPCIQCNARLKFGKLREAAEMFDASFLATGHYARIREINGQNMLCRAIDIAKDQSYALFAIGRETLSQVLLPDGEYSKPRIREFAREMNLPVHDKGESQEICFVPQDDYAGFVAKHCPSVVRPGNIVDTSGKVLGQHEGIYRYTIGQRRGLGIALGEPAYVIRLDAKENTVVLGSRQELMQNHLCAKQVRWMIDPIPEKPFDATVQIRYNHRGAPAKVNPVADDSGLYTEVQIEFSQPVPAITPGQAAVFYKEEAVLGGGWIEYGCD